jgi:TonB family protein
MVHLSSRGEERCREGRYGSARRSRARVAAVPAWLFCVLAGGLAPATAPGPAVAASLGDSPSTLTPSLVGAAPRDLDPDEVKADKAAREFYRDRVRAARDLVEIEALLRQGDGKAALARLRAEDTRLVKSMGRGVWLAGVAVAEAASGQRDQALWHWAVANALVKGAFTDQELSAFSVFGDAGALLAEHRGRQPGKAPPGMSIEPPGPEVEQEVQTKGELPQLVQSAWSPREWLRLEVVIDEQGRVRDPVVLSARSEEAAYRALEAMRDWRFEPARKRGQPVATLHTLVVNPPGQRALDQVINLSAQTKAIEGMLRRQEWKQAADEAQRHWYALLDSTGRGHDQEPERAALGMTMALWALAREGMNPGHSWARCRWEAGQALMPTLYDLDLSPYGPAGEALAAWRSESFAAPWKASLVRPRAESPRGEVTRPQKIAVRAPYYPPAAKKERLDGKVILEAIIDTEGRVRNPTILVPAEAGDQVTFAASAVDTVCDWRFKPATLEGRPVKVYYTLTVNFEARSH